MRRSLIILAILTISVFWIGRATVLASGPKIHIQESEYDFGTIDRGEMVKHKFTFENKGDEELIITDVKTSCGCTAAVTSAKSIAPGKEGTLEVTFNSKGRQGPQTKTVTIVTNDPEKPRALIRLTGKVDIGEQPIMQVTPRILDVGVLEPGKSAELEITVSNTGTTDLVLEDFIGRNNLSVKDADGEMKKKTVKPGESLKLTVVVRPDVAQGIYQAYLQIRNNSAQKTVTLPVYGYISNKYMLKPETREQGQSPSKK